MSIILRHLYTALVASITYFFGLAAFASPLVHIPKLWNGEIVEAEQGLVCLYALMIDSQVQPRHGSFQFVLKGQRLNTYYRFSVATQDAGLPPQSYWKIKEDTYDVVEASFIDERGNKRMWKGPGSKKIIVRPRSLTTLGRWYLVYMRTDSQFKLLIKPFSFKLPLERFKESVQTVVDGMTGHIYARSGGKAAANPDYSLRRVIRGTRSIQMIYRLDLFRMNSLATEMIKVIDSHDGELRGCFIDLLDKQSEAHGNLNYSFIYSGINQGIKSLKLKPSTLNDPGFLECMELQLRGLDFPLSKSLAGELNFQFKVSEK